MGVPSADPVAVDGAEHMAPGNGRSALCAISDLPGPRRLPLIGNAHGTSPAGRVSCWPTAIGAFATKPSQA